MEILRKATFDQLSRVIISLKLQYYPTLDIIKPYGKRHRVAVIKSNDLTFITPITYAIYQPMICEPKTYLFFNKILKEGEVSFLDVGAAIGAYALLAAKRKNYVVAMEPNLFAFLTLQINAQINKLNIIGLRLAAYNQRRMIKIDEDWVEAILIDDIGETFDIIKIDVDGYEKEVAEGAMETLRRCKYAIIEERSETFECVHRIMKKIGKKPILYEKLCAESFSGSLLRPRVKPRDFNVVYSD